MVLGFREILAVALINSMTLPCLSQGLNNLWMGGYATFASPPYGASEIDFQSGAPIITWQPTRTVDLYRTSANISDSLGNLLFFTNGVVVGGQNGDTLQNGTGLNPGEYAEVWYPDGLAIPQAALSIEFPGFSQRYYIFHCTVDDIPNNTAQFLYTTIVDMSMNGGQGGVELKNQVIHTGPMQAGRLDAVRHGNGRDWWVYAHEAGSARYFRFLVSPNGIDGPFDQFIGVVRAPDSGRTAFSPDGSKFAYYWGESDLDIFSVDRCTGLFGEPVHIEIEDYNGSGGVAFSPSSRYLYVSSVFDVYQVDTDVADISSSITHIAEWDSTYSPAPPFATLFNAAQLAPDGKVYLSTGNATDKLHVINHPDSPGLACDLVQNGITLPTYWFNSLPNHPNYHLGPLAGSPCDTLGLSVAEHAVRLNLSLYPNPNSGAVTLTYAPQPVAGVLEVYDLHGKCVYTAQVAPWSQLKCVELPTMPAGVYLCRLRFGASIATQRLVIE